MIWLTWRQFRAQAITATAALAVLAALLAVTGPHLADLYATSGIATCHLHGDFARPPYVRLDRDDRRRETIPVAFALQAEDLSKAA